MNCLLRPIVSWFAEISIALAAAIALTPGILAREQTAEEREPVYRGRTLDVWIRMLDGTDDEQLVAIKAIGEFGPEARAHADVLAKKLSSIRDDIRLEAANQLATWGPDAKSTGVDLARTLVDIDPEIGAAAATALRSIGKAANDETRIAVANAIGDRDSAVREHAISVMKEIGWHEGSVAVLRQALISKEARVRYAALKAVANVPTSLGVPLRDRIYPLLVDAGLLIRLETIKVLERIGVDGGFAAALAAAIDHADDEIKRNGLQAIRMTTLGAAAKPIAPKIAALLEHEEWDIRESAALALWKLDYHDRRAARVLGESISTGRSLAPSPDVITAIGDLGPLATEAAPLLIKHFESPRQSDDEKVANAIAASVARIGPDAVKTFAGLLESRRGELRVAAAKAIESLGEKAEPAIPALAAALADTEIDVRIHAAKALGNLGSSAKSAAPLLADAVRKEFGQYRAGEIDSRRQGFGDRRKGKEFFTINSRGTGTRWLPVVAEASWRVSRDPHAIEALEKMLVDLNDDARDLALAALDRSVIDPRASSVPALNNVLRFRVAGYATLREDDSVFERMQMQYGTDGSIIYALRVLERIGADGKPDLEAVKRIAEADTSPEVSLAAARALWRLGHSPHAATLAAECLAVERFAQKNRRDDTSAAGRDSNARSPSAVVEVLAEMGDAAKTALPQIKLAYQQATDDETKAAIGSLLKKLDPDAAGKLGVR